MSNLKILQIITSKQLLDEYYSLCKKNNILCDMNSLNKYINYIKIEIKNKKRKFNYLNFKIMKNMAEKYIGKKIKIYHNLINTNKENKKEFKIHKMDID